MKTVDVDLGVLCTWEVADRTSITELRQQLPVDFLKLLPDQKRHAKAILRDAIRDYYGVDSAIVIRPQESDTESTLRGFSVFQEVKHKPDTPNELTPIATIAVQSDGVVSVPTGSADAAEIQKRFDVFSEQLSASTVSSLFIDAIDKLDGTGGIRPAGGIYFLLHDSVPVFEKIVEAAQAAAIKGSTQVFMFTVSRDAKTISSVHSAVARELKQFIAATELAVCSGKIGKAALKTQLSNIQKQAQRLAKFEASLGSFTSDVKQELEDLQRAALLTQMTLVGDVDGEE